ncbi:uncharacterized protein Z518_03885 [Rhinocladiella mackenziei CBS 650.93]|uniref:Checkpoint protein RAD24-like helical bundle domain-containing protein n=1 Tax=Rhinocladiella mackenziei CBS 650.93 TaxID=1442369 RepID=A0A0D2IRZ6_9EURO|nr:uncharacterized protein Z518_03885 [Rhinocladiella mackenziei CBS 650.93]KIX05911.1 hypothetical protein Z518_03885 [Rhinocladiella mackenziei CBS 650.93]
MASRPAKRQRRATIVLSDDSDDVELPSPNVSKPSLQREITLDGRTSQTVSPTKPTKGKSISKRATPKASPKSSPEKTRKKTRSKTEPDQSRSLHNFFGKATEEQRWTRKSATPDLDLENGELGDAIEDDDLSDETLQDLRPRTDRASATLDRQKPTVPAIANLKNISNAGSLPSSQRFVRTTASRRGIANIGDQVHVPNQDRRPWADRYGPNNLEELVVHKKKVADVQNWLQGKINGSNSQKILTLKGPAGSGKTTTVSLLAKAMGLQMVQWHNPTVSETGASNSIAHQFDEFLNRGGYFGSLSFEHDSLDSECADQDPDHRVLVIEEFPANTTSNSTTLQSFRNVILQFLARARMASSSTFGGQRLPNDSVPPVVVIISETLLSSSTAFADGFTAHRLLGAEILNHPFVTVMEFNPVAPTFVTKALDLVIKKEARDSRRRRIPGPAVIQRLVEMGDVRNAVNSLEFLCVRGGDGSEWSGTVAAKTKKTSRDKDSVLLTEMEKNSLQLVSQRETTLDMFHAAGRIVYNKREDPRVRDTRAEPPPKPPDHLMHLYTPKTSQVDIEALLSETGTDIQTFISTLHENYILSCNGDHFEGSFDGCSDILSTADILNPENRPLRRGNTNPNAGVIQARVQAGSSDTLRQDEIGFHVATRGLLFNLPYPVNRANPPGGKRGDNFKMFYPASLRLWKPTEEMESLIEMFVHGDSSARADFRSGSGSVIPGVDGGVASWRTRTFTATRIPTIKSKSGTELGKQDGNDDDDDHELAPYSLPIHHAKDTLTLEILPFMTRIYAAKDHDISILERITRFNPSGFISSAAGEDGFEEDEHNDNDSGSAAGIGIGSIGTGVGPVPAPTQFKASSSGLRRNTMPRPGGQQKHDPSAAALNDVAVEKLYISDDDIEDY